MTKTKQKEQVANMWFLYFFLKSIYVNVAAASFIASFLNLSKSPQENRLWEQSQTHKQYLRQN